MSAIPFHWALSSPNNPMKFFRQNPLTDSKLCIKISTYIEFEKGCVSLVALRTIDVRNDFKRVSDIIRSGEKVLIARPHNENLVVLSEKEYNELEKARHNAEYKGHYED
jgi:antitoxin YefM